jgi:hypothetical protein
MTNNGINQKQKCGNTGLEFAIIKFYAFSPCNAADIEATYHLSIDTLFFF